MFVLPSGAAHTNQHSVVILCIIVWKIHVEGLFLSLSSLNAEQTIFFLVAFFKTVTSSGKPAKLLQHASFGRKRVGKAIINGVQCKE